MTTIHIKNIYFFLVPLYTIQEADTDQLKVTKKIGSEKKSIKALTLK